ncbi:MAG TPA: thioredoxin [Gammaproteobacteria bacterium]|nr:thioredoxin [Gammaproteobacteria bacterium]
MSTRELTADNFDSTIENNKLVLIDFWASWCGPCRSFAPIFSAAAEKNPGIVFAKVDTEAQQQLAAQFQIRSIPTLAIFKEQVMIFSQPGALPASALDQLIEQAQSLDMDEVRKDLEEKQRSHATA